MIRSKYTTLLLLLVLHARAWSQTGWFRADTTSKVRIGELQLRNPWAGGLNAAQFSSMDLNGDGINDLVVFDRTNEKLSTFIGNATTKTYTYAPEYEKRFPTLQNWMLLVDYNNDNIKELFTYTPQGVKVYKQKTVNGTWQWELFSPLLYTQGFSEKINLLVVATDIPALIDVDDDGDLDIVTFEIFGDYAEMHLNQSMEKYGVPDSLDFVRNGNCWGNFIKHLCDDFTIGFDCGASESPSRTNNSTARILHAGNSLLLKDLNGDGKKDMLFGYIACENLAHLINTGTNRVANFSSFVARYPEKDPVFFNVFPAAYSEDIDFDGISDLVAAPNVSTNEGNLIDFASSNWVYHNAGTENIPDYILRQKNFLQDQMIDVGENAAPVFWDIDGDGDKDLLIGTGGTLGDDFRASIWLFTNTGTAQAPVYELTTKNFLQISNSFKLTTIVPQLADFDGNGTIDLGFSGLSSRTIEYRYLPNKALPGQAISLLANEAVTLPLPPEILIGDAPFFYDADKDGDLDLVVGKSLGNISYYLNTGSATKFNLVLQTTEFAGYTVNLAARNASVSVEDINLDGKPEMITTSQQGKIKIHHSGEWGAWTKVDTLLIANTLLQPEAPYLGTFLKAIATDFNGDAKPDLVVGTNAGGIRLFSNILPISPPEQDWSLNVFPNPAQEYIRIHSDKNATLDLFSMHGVQLNDQPIEIKANFENTIAVSSWTPGLYLFRIKDGSGTTLAVKKIIIQ